jgi:uncharacterized protein (TIGR04255 family)
MPEPRHLPNAPIREALIDISVRPHKGLDLEIMRKLCGGVTAQYPNIVEVREAELELDFTQEPNRVSQTHTVTGFRCVNKDGNKLVQFRLNGFTYNWLRPYSHWADLSDAAKDLWHAYAEATKPTLVTRVGLRYINNLEFPAPFKDLREYLTSPPAVPAQVPQQVTRFLTRISVVDESTNNAAIITQAFEGIVDPRHVTVILDIDTSKRAEFIGDDEIWQTLEGLHTFKNQIFFNSLTEEAVRLFE